MVNSCLVFQHWKKIGQNTWQLSFSSLFRNTPLAQLWLRIRVNICLLFQHWKKIGQNTWQLSFSSLFRNTLLAQLWLRIHKNKFLTLIQHSMVNSCLVFQHWKKIGQNTWQLSISSLCRNTLLAQLWPRIRKNKFLTLI